MAEVEADALIISSKYMEVVEAPMPTDTSAGALMTREWVMWINNAIPYAVVEVAKENQKKEAKNMTEGEDDALKMLPKTMEAVKCPCR